MNRTLEHILPRVQKPARYTGGEYNAVVKDRRAVDVRYALCFPDTYEIGMSNLGVRILYGLMNEMDGVWCERVFAPWGDMEEEMRREGIPLYGLESGDSIADFDLIGFSLGYEMAYTNVLNMLDLAGLPLRSGERTELSPIVVAGGTCAFNPEPLAPFVDLFVLGEGEDVSVEIIQLYRQAREEGWGKEEFLTAAARIPGVYVPSLYEVSYHGDGTVAAVTPLEGAPARVTKRIVQDFDKSYFPVKTIVPSTEIVHDRVMLEVFRGCIRGCRFCQAGYAYRPVRPRNPQRLVQQGIEACRDSGYQEMTLSSLSTSDYRALEGLCDGLLEWCEPNKVSLSLPSLRADNFSLGLMERVQHVRKSGLTFAPEAGTQRLRDVINKNVTEDDLFAAIDAAFAAGFDKVKVNTVLMRDVNHHQLDTFLAWIQPRRIQLRFIELMETGEGSDLFRRHHLSGMVLRDELLRRGWIHQIRQRSDGPAQVFCHPDYAGEIGLIMPYEKDFCATCNRLRVSSVGKLHLCLFGEGGVDLRDLMAEDQQQAALEVRIAEALTHKKQTHFLHQGNTGITQNLSYIGG